MVKAKSSVQALFVRRVQVPSFSLGLVIELHTTCRTMESKVARGRVRLYPLPWTSPIVLPG